MRKTLCLPALLCGLLILNNGCRDTAPAQSDRSSTVIRREHIQMDTATDTQSVVLPDPEPTDR